MNTRHEIVQSLLGLVDLAKHASLDDAAILLHYVASAIKIEGEDVVYDVLMEVTEQEMRKMIPEQYRRKP